MNQITTKWQLPRLGVLQPGIIALTVITAVIHLYLGISSAAEGTPPGFSVQSMLPILFVLNFEGYMVLVTAHYLPVLQRFQRLTRWLLIGYTALTILLWYIIASDNADLIDYITKSIEVVLIVFLLLEDRQARRRAPGNTHPQTA